MITLSGLAPKQYSVTEAGLRSLQQQLEELRSRRRGVTDQIREISSQGTDMGMSVDSTFAENRSQANELDGQIALLERIIAMADVIPKPRDKARAQLGSTVTVSMEGKERTYTLVGAVEADPAEGRISDESPFGRSLLGKQIDDAVEVASPRGLHISARVVGIE